MFKILQLYDKKIILVLSEKWITYLLWLNQTLAFALVRHYSVLFKALSDICDIAFYENSYDSYVHLRCLAVLNTPLH